MRRRITESDSVDVLYVITDVQSTVFIAPVVACLSQRGVKVGLVTNMHGQPLPHDLDSHLHWHHSLAMRRNPSPLKDLSHLFCLMWFMWRLRPTVTHVSTPKAGLLGGVAAWLMRVPKRVYQVRGLRAEGSSGVFRRILLALEWLAMRVATVVVIESASLRTALSELGVSVPANATMIGAGSSIGVDCNRFAPSGRTSPGVPARIGFIGRLHSDKGLADMAQVISDLRQVQPDATLTVVGEVDSTDPAAQGLVDGLRGSVGVEFRGHLSDVSAELQAWDVLLFPTRREGLPNAPLEAQACGVPVVGYAATGVVDAVANGVGGVLVPVGDVEALSNAVAAVVGEANRWAELSSGGRAFVLEHFERGKVVESHSKFLEDQIASLGADV